MRRKQKDVGFLQYDIFSLMQETTEKKIEQICVKAKEEARKEKQSSSMQLDLFSFMEEIEEQYGAEETVTPVVSIPKPSNYRVANDNIGVGTPKERFANNIKAIKLVYELEANKRFATKDEQDILANYVGWGGLADAFDKDKCPEMHEELINTLTKEDYEQARGSVLNAHFTPPAIIRAIWDKIVSFGFTTGNVLEPCCGIGNFFGSMPESLKNKAVNLFGIEIDRVSALITKHLYPGVKTENIGFEKYNKPDNFFDVVIGNVPFGDYSLNDPRYNANKFLIHDYFFAKSIDLCRAGGIVALITSKGTLDKLSKTFREYLSCRATLLGAIRLPNSVFKGAAGTSVISDILFLQKKEIPCPENTEWLSTSIFEDDVRINDYFTNHPDNIVGDLKTASGPYGKRLVCELPETEIEGAVRKALSNIHGSIINNDYHDEETDDISATIPAIDGIKNNSFAVVDNKVYVRRDSMMYEYKPKYSNDCQKIIGMCKIRDLTYKVIDLQINKEPEDMIKKAQSELNSSYDAYINKYGYLNNQSNKRLFSDDAAAGLLLSLENIDNNGMVVGKADIFTKMTIRPKRYITNADTSLDALIISLSEKGRIDLEYMMSLTNKPITKIVEDLKGKIYKNPIGPCYELASEYLSGNIRQKLEIAKAAAEDDDIYKENVIALEKAMPEPLGPSEVVANLGCTWIDTKYINQFMIEVLNRTNRSIVCEYSSFTGEWRIQNKNNEWRNATITTMYGTSRKNGFEILEDSLNQRASKVYDTTSEGKSILNKKETTLALQKQEMLKEKFKDWLYEDKKRRDAIISKYNELYNSIRLREYDGSFLEFPGMNPNINLKPYQKNAVARQIFGGNTLLAHCVGAGKTYEMIAACMEGKRLGKFNKSLFVVPNHLIGQWAKEFYTLYPGCNVLYPTKKDFEPKNRKRFCARIATGNYDAVIIGHSQFDKLSVSNERLERYIRNDIADATGFIADMKESNGSRYSIKQAEIFKKQMQKKLELLLDKDSKDNTVDFESLGIDKLFVDESHYYKNLYTFSKIQAAGMQSTDAKKTSAMYYKCRYLNEVTGEKGITFATGTPITNSLVELYTNMKYLSMNRLCELGLDMFDSWAATFAEVVSQLELAPEGTGFRINRRLAKYNNIPELINLFRCFADIQTSDMLDLPIPKANRINVKIAPSKYQKDMVLSYAERAEKIRSGGVDPSIDNMLKITMEGRKLALDPKLIDIDAPHFDVTKADKCVENCIRLYKENPHTAHMIFCDQSTPKADTYNVYDVIRDKLIENGVKKEEIAYIHDANTDKRKEELFAKVRSTEVKFILGSTLKMGAGTNCQDYLKSLHHLDVPWRPADIEQQEGRILRQGNNLPEVDIYTYITEGTFDAYSWQTIETKQKFISQIMTGKSPARNCEDLDDAVLNYGEIKALATGNPLIKEKMQLDIDVSKLKLMKTAHKNNIYSLEQKIENEYPAAIINCKEKVEQFKADVSTYNQNIDDNTFYVYDTETNSFKEYGADKRINAGIALVSAIQSKATSKFITLAKYKGFEIQAQYDEFNKSFTCNVRGKSSNYIQVEMTPAGITTRIINVLEKLESRYKSYVALLEATESQYEDAKVLVTKPFEKEEELNTKLARLTELNQLLNMDTKTEQKAS